MKLEKYLFNFLDQETEEGEGEGLEGGTEEEKKEGEEETEEW